MTSGPVRVAVIGAGNMGRHHVRVLAQMGGLAGVCDIDATRAALARQLGARFYADYADLLDQERPDAVVIAVPARERQEIAEAVLRRGLPTLVEKPVAAGVAEAETLQTLAKQHGALLGVGHVERYNPAVRRLRELVRSGQLGRISNVVCKRVGGFPAIEPSSDVLVDLAVHDIDIVSWLLDAEPRLIGAHASRTHHRSLADSAEILLGFDGASGFIQANWITPVKLRTIAVTGSQGYVDVNYITQEIRIYRHSQPSLGPGFEGFVKQLGRPRARIERPAAAEPLAEELKAFVDAVRSGRTDDLVSAAEATRALSVALSATRELVAA